MAPGSPELQPRAGRLQWSTALGRSPGIGAGRGDVALWRVGAAPGAKEFDML